MNKLQAYRAFLNFIDEFNKIESIFDNFKNEIDSLNKNQFGAQSRKILSLVSKLNITESEDILEILKDHPVYRDFLNQYNIIKEKIKDIKDFIYSQEEKPDEEEIEIEQPTKKTKPEIIKSKFNFLEKQIDEADIEVCIKDAKALEREVSRLDFEDLPEGDYDDMVSIKNNLARIIKTLAGVQKSEKYGPYLQAPLSDMIEKKILFGSKERADSKAAAILDFIEDPERIDMFEPAIKRIIARKMTTKEFKTFYESVMSMITGQSKLQAFKDYETK